MDNVNSPKHYIGANGTETIDFIEESCKDAPSGYEGYLQGNILKYMSRVWRKENSLQDLQKAEWYLKKLIQQQTPTTTEKSIDELRGRKPKYNAVTANNFKQWQAD